MTDSQCSATACCIAIPPPNAIFNAEKSTSVKPGVFNNARYKVFTPVMAVNRVFHDGDPIAGLHARDVAAHLGHHAGVFVSAAAGHGEAHQALFRGSAHPPVEVAPADAQALDLDDDGVVVDLGPLGVNQSDVARSHKHR